MRKNASSLRWENYNFKQAPCRYNRMHTPCPFGPHCYYIHDSDDAMLLEALRTYQSFQLPLDNVRRWIETHTVPPNRRPLLQPALPSESRLNRYTQRMFT